MLDCAPFGIVFNVVRFAAAFTLYGFEMRSQRSQLFHRRSRSVRIFAILVVVATTGCIGNTPAPPCQGKGVLINGECRSLCETDKNCGPGLECSDANVCIEVAPQCVNNTDCTTPGPCQTAAAECRQGVCHYPPVAPGQPCADGDLCTDGDECNAVGKCIGTPRVCDSPPVNLCAGGGMATLYAAAGVCTEGLCRYSSSNLACSDCPACLTGCALNTGGDAAVDLLLAPAQANPSNACETCEPGLSARSYSPVVCAARALSSVCLALDGSCTASGELDCRAGDCCGYPPLWPQGSTDPAPACPLSGEDVNEDGQPGAETWTGLCDHEGQCTGCGGDGDCDDNNPCTADSCTNDAIRTCAHVVTGGVACPVFGAADGTCVATADSAVCRLSDGEKCQAGAGDCASGSCTCADASCIERRCHATGCTSCAYLDQEGSCSPTAEGQKGERCTATGFACSAAAECVPTTMDGSFSVRGAVPVGDKGGPAVQDRHLTLDVLVSADITQMQVSLDAEFLNAAWIPVAKMAQISAPKDGRYSVYMKFLASTGAQTSPTARKVVVDSTGPVVYGSLLRWDQLVNGRVFEVRGGDTVYSNDRRLMVALTAIFNVLEPVELMVSLRDARFAQSTWQAVGTKYPITSAAIGCLDEFSLCFEWPIVLSDNDGSHKIYMRARDRLGNEVAIADATILNAVLDRVAPSPVFHTYLASTVVNTGILDMSISGIEPPGPSGIELLVSAAGGGAPYRVRGDFTIGSGHTVSTAIDVSFPSFVTPGSSLRVVITDLAQNEGQSAPMDYFAECDNDLASCAGTDVCDFVTLKCEPP